jgi:hypothetical protein
MLDEDEEYEDDVLYERRGTPVLRSARPELVVPTPWTSWRWPGALNSRLWPRACAATGKRASMSGRGPGFTCAVLGGPSGACKRGKHGKRGGGGEVTYKPCYVQAAASTSTLMIRQQGELGWWLVVSRLREGRLRCAAGCSRGGGSAPPPGARRAWQSASRQQRHPAPVPGTPPPRASAVALRWRCPPRLTTSRAVFELRRAARLRGAGRQRGRRRAGRRPAHRCEQRCRVGRSPLEDA